MTTGKHVQRTSKTQKPIDPRMKNLPAAVSILASQEANAIETINQQTQSEVEPSFLSPNQSKVYLNSEIG